jgi:hypothetical protein
MSIRQLLVSPATVLFMSLVVADVASSQETLNVTGLRMNRITLYKDCDTTQGVPFTREDLEKRKPWPATRDPSSTLNYWVTMDGQKYCVRAFAVETDQAVTVGGECQPRVAGGQPKTGAVRGVGETCGDGGIEATPPVPRPGGGRPVGPPAGTQGNRPR